MAMRLVQERAWRAKLNPMQRYHQQHQHLLIGSVGISVSNAPPAAVPVPDPAPAAAVEPEAPDVPETSEVDPTRYMARVYGPSAIYEARELLGASAGKAGNKPDAATLARSAAALDRAARDDGWRSVPWAGPDAVEDPFAALGPELANFAEVLAHLRAQWTLARRAHCAADARLDPTLLLGPPEHVT